MNKAEEIHNGQSQLPRIETRERSGAWHGAGSVNGDIADLKNVILYFNSIRVLRY